MKSWSVQLLACIVCFLQDLVHGASVIRSFSIPNEAAMKTAHHTSEYRTNAWYITRRGNSVTLRVLLDSDVTDRQSLALQCSPYSIFDTSTIAITPAGANTYDITAKIRDDAPIGAFTIGVRLTDQQRATQLSRQVAVMFNPWNVNDATYYPNAAQLDEYINNENGVTYRGSTRGVQAVRWYFGQFDHNVMRVLLHQVNRLDEKSRSDPALVSRFLTSAMTAQETNPDGLMVGKWEGGYAGGVNPLSWSSSDQIVNRYIAQGFHPVQFSQCWVFAAVLQSFLRAVGIASRHESNFDSAHEVPKSPGTFTQEVYRYWDPWSRRMIAELGQIWNFHAWNSVYMKHNHTLDQYKHAHWHKVDGTPQEHSGDRFQLGPASLEAVKAQVKTTFDTSFVISEVNAKIRNWNARCPWLPAGKLKYLPQGCVVTADQGVENRIPSGSLILTKGVGKNNWKSDTIQNQYHNRNTGIIGSQRGADYVISMGGSIVTNSGSTNNNNGWGNTNNNNGWSNNNNGWGNNNNNNGWSNNNNNNGWSNSFRSFSHDKCILNEEGVCKKPSTLFFGDGRPSLKSIVDLDFKQTLGDFVEASSVDIMDSKVAELVHLNEEEGKKSILQTNIAPHLKIDIRIEHTIVGEPISTVLRISCHEEKVDRSIPTDEEEDWGKPHKVHLQNVDEKKQTKVCQGDIPVSLVFQQFTSDYRGEEREQLREAQIDVELNELNEYKQVIQLIKRLDMEDIKLPLSPYIHANVYAVDQSSVRIAHEEEIDDEVTITADTVVSSDNHMLELPKVYTRLNKDLVFTGHVTHTVLDVMKQHLSEDKLAEMKNTCLNLYLAFDNPQNVPLTQVQQLIHGDNVDLPEETIYIGTIEPKQHYTYTHPWCITHSTPGAHLIHATIESKELPPLHGDTELKVDLRMENAPPMEWNDVETQETEIQPPLESTMTEVVM